MKIVAAKRRELGAGDEQRFLRDIRGVGAVGDTLGHESMDVGRGPFYPMQVVLPAAVDSERRIVMCVPGYGIQSAAPAA